MHISENFNLPIHGHKDIDFIDIDTENDTNLYLDPYVIQALENGFCRQARIAIDSFFHELFWACKNDNIKRITDLLTYANEPNETNLGMKRKSKYGKGSTATKLTELFCGFYHTVSMNPLADNYSTELCVFMKNFDKDKMSDLITNIIRNLLYEFTMEQCKKWKIEVSPSIKPIGNYWDPNECTWKKLYGTPLLINNKSILLVPKIITRKRYVFNVERYIKQYALRVLQEQHLLEKSDMCHIKQLKKGTKVEPPTIQELYEHEVYGNNHKDYALEHSANNQKLEDLFIKETLEEIRDGLGSINDNRLDTIVYNIKKAA